MNARQLAILAAVEDDHIRRAVYALLTGSSDELKAVVAVLPSFRPVVSLLEQTS